MARQIKTDPDTAERLWRNHWHTCEVCIGKGDNDPDCKFYREAGELLSEARALFHEEEIRKWKKREGIR